MGTELSPMESFKEKVKSKVREDIAGMIPEEVVQGLVEEALREVFFKDREVGDSWKRKTEPSWFKQLVKEHAEWHVKEQVLAVLNSQEHQLRAAIKEILDENVFPLTMATVAGDLVSQQVRDALFEFQNTLRGGNY